MPEVPFTIGMQRQGSRPLNAPVLPLKLPRISFVDHPAPKKTKPGPEPEPKVPDEVPHGPAKPDRIPSSEVAARGPEAAQHVPRQGSGAQAGAHVERPWRGVGPQQPALGVGHPMGGRQWVRMERMDQPNPAARATPPQRTPLPGSAATPVMPDINDRAVNREPGQMTLFPDLPHDRPIADQTDPATYVETGEQQQQQGGGQTPYPGGWVNQQSQGALFRPRTDKEQMRQDQKQARQQSQQAWGDS